MENEKKLEDLTEEEMEALGARVVAGDKEAAWISGQYLITDEVFNGFMDAFAGDIRRNAIGEEEFMPRAAILIHTPNGKERYECRFAELVEMDEDHERMFADLAYSLHRMDPNDEPVAIMFASEAWQADMPKESKTVRPSQSPNRIETLVMSGQTLDGRTALRSDKIVRKDGKIAKLENLHDMPYEKDGEAQAESPMLRAFYTAHAYAMKGISLETMMKVAHGETPESDEVAKVAKEALEAINRLPEGKAKQEMLKQYERVQQMRRNKGGE